MDKKYFKSKVEDRISFKLFNMLQSTPVVFANSSEPQELTDDPFLCALIGDYDKYFCLVSYNDFENFFDLTPELWCLLFLRSWPDGKTLGELDYLSLPQALIDQRD